MTRSAFYLVLGQAATTALAVTLTGTIGRALGAADFGNWYVLSAMATFAYVFVDWGYSPYIIREVARHPARAGELTGTVLALRAATAILICAPAYLAAWGLGYSPRLQALAILNIAVSMPMMLLTSFTWTLRGRERLDLESCITVTLKLLTVAVTFALLAGGLQLFGVIVAQGISGAASFLIALWLFARAGQPPLRVTLSTASELIREAAPMFSIGLMIAMQPYVDANILARTVPPEVVGWYGATAVFTGTLLAPALILGAAVYPRLSRAADDPAAFRALVRSATRPLLYLATLATVGTYAFAPFAIDTVYHKASFAPAATVLRAFSLNLFLVSVDVLLGNVILASGRIARFARAKIVAVVVTVGLELVLVPICQARFGNGGIGVVLSFTAGELLLIVAAMRIVPAGLFGRETALDGVRAAAAAGAALLATRAASGLSSFAAIPITVAAHLAVSVGVGLISRHEIAQVLALLPWRPRGGAAAGPAAPAAQLRIGKLAVDVLTRAEAVARIERLVESGRGGAVYTPNVDHVVRADSSAALCAVYEQATLAIADGMPLVWLSRLLPQRLPERVAGSDVAPPLMEIAAQRGWRVFLVGGAPGVAEIAGARLRECGVNVVGCAAPRVTSDGRETEDAAFDRVRLAKPHLVIVGLGSPKQEFWIARARPHLDGAVLCGFGAVIDFLAGVQRRAPEWIARSGFEWLYRLGREPRRLWRRYLVDDSRFAVIAVATWWRARTGPPVDLAAEGGRE